MQFIKSQSKGGLEISFFKFFLWRVKVRENKIFYFKLSVLIVHSLKDLAEVTAWNSACFRFLWQAAQFSNMINCTCRYECKFLGSWQTTYMCKATMYRIKFSNLSIGYCKRDMVGEGNSTNTFCSILLALPAFLQLLSVQFWCRSSQSIEIKN